LAKANGNEYSKTDFTAAILIFIAAPFMGRITSEIKLALAKIKNKQVGMYKFAYNFNLLNYIALKSSALLALPKS
jgi:hypothetical protein